MTKRPKPLTDEEEKRGAERIAAFSDGVFAIAITLLVLDLKIPSLPEGYSIDQLHAALSAAIPKTLVYFLTFILVGTYWMGHHRKFATIVRTDTGFIWINLIFLMAVAFLPFPSSLLSEYGDRQIVQIIYAVSNGVAVGLSTLVWLYAWRGHRLIRDDLDLRLAMEGTVKTGAIAICFVLTIPLSFLGSVWVWVWWAMVIPVGSVATRLYARRYGPLSDSAGTVEDPDET